jgi:ribonuclease E
MSKQIIIAEQYRIAAVFAQDQIQELIVAKGTHQIGDIYLGVVENVLPGIDAAFVNIGDNERNGFIHVSDLGPLRLRRMSGAITELLAPQQTVLVQVMKEPTGSKGPRLTGNLSLPGRYLVLMPFKRGVNLSRRIDNEAERSRLRALAILVKPASMGLLVRTEAEGVAEEAIIEDLEALQRQWETIQQEAESTRAPALLNRDDDFIQRVLRDVYTADVNRIVTDSVSGLKRVKQHLMSWASGKVPPGLLIDQHRERTSILEYFRINAAIREALKPRVDLPSGGYIVIELTEALTVIDVNSGSFTRSATARETVLWTNFEAAAEIARQLRLRNLAGVIVVDFIDMDSRKDQLQVLQHFEQALKADKARPQIAQLSELGLVELTRKRQGQNIYELFGHPCPHCGGLGHVAYLPGEPVPAALDQEGEEEQLYYDRVSDARLLETRGSQAASTIAVDRAAPLQENRPLVLDPPKDSQKPAWDLPVLNDQVEPGTGDSLETSYYPDRGGNRRRRRRNEDEPPSRSLPFELPNGGLDDPLPTRWAEPGQRSTDSPRPLRDSPEDRLRQREGFTGTNDGPVRFGTRRGRIPSKPPEIVTVEMTDTEQEVYAWMGVSPLLLAQQPIEDPRSAVVRIQPPSDSTPEVAGTSLLVEELVEEPHSPEEDERPDAFETPAVVTNPLPIKRWSQAEEEPFSAETDASENMELPDSSLASEEPIENRRRRRRSSALGGINGLEGDDE